MTSKLKFLFSKMPEAVQWLLGKEVEPEHFECNKCCCPVCVFFYAKPDYLGARCASCGAKTRVMWRVDNSRLEQIAVEARWNKAIKDYEREFGHWWFDMWFCAPRGH